MDKQDSGFSLVELLVVMAIISTLAAMLLPSIEDALNSARVSACSNNLRQMHLNASMYANTFAGSLPRGPSNPSIDFDNYRRNALYGWSILISSGFITPNGVPGQFTLMNYPGFYTACPDNPRYMDWRDGQYYHYGYRYNTANANGASSWQKDSLNSRVADMILFSEASCSRYFQGCEALPDSGLSYYGPYRWAHALGGNMISHSGTGRFIPNALADGWPLPYPSLYYAYYQARYTNLDAIWKK